MQSYKQKIIGIVLNIKNKLNIAALKRELIEFFKILETDDKLYLLNPSGLSFEKRGKAVSCLSQYNFHDNLPMHLLLRDAIAALNVEPFDASKIICVISDCDFDKYQVEKMLGLAHRSGIKIVGYEMNEEFGRICPSAQSLENFDKMSEILFAFYTSKEINEQQSN